MQDPYALDHMQEPVPADPYGMDDPSPQMGELVPFPVMMSPEEIEHIERNMELRQRVINLQKMAGIDNVAELLEDEELSKIGAQVVREYQIDKDSREEWETRARRAMDLARQKKDAKTFPWADAANVKFPMLTTAALQFAARAYPAIVDGPRIVKCQVMGSDPGGVKSAAGDRVSQHMSYQLLYELPEWEADMDTALHQIPIVGCAFKKVYQNGAKASGFSSDLVSAFDFVVNQRAKSLETVPRATHIFPLYPHEIGERKRDGRFLDVELSTNADDKSGSDEDAPHMFLEQHRYLDLDDDGVPEPWIVTVHETTKKVVRIKPCFDPSAIDIDQQRGKIVRIPRKDYFVKIPFIPDPDGGFYDVGFGHLLEPLSDVIDTTINQMMDAGTLQNAGGGFIGSGVQLGKGKAEIRFRPGEYKTVTTAGNDLRQGIVNVEHPGPSKVLFELLSLMIDSGKDIAAIQDILVGDMPRNQTATATMAMIEQGLKVFTAIYKRIFRALKAEFKMIFEINKATLNAPRYVALLDEPVQVVQDDYMGDLDVMPVCDPSTITDMQRMSKAQFVLEEAKAGNSNIDMRAATIRAFEAARIERIEELVPPQNGPTPQEQIGLEGALAEVEKIKADIEKTRAETEKTVIEAVMARMQAMIPIGAPVPVPAPQFAPQTLVQIPGEQPPPMMEDPAMMGMPPEVMPMDQGMPPEMMMEDPQGFAPAYDMEQGIPPELMDAIAAEQMAAGDAMPGDGMMA